MFNFHFLNRSIDNLENQLVNAARVSAFLYQSVFQLYKAMYYQLSLVAIQICVKSYLIILFWANAFNKSELGWSASETNLFASTTGTSEL